MAMQTGIDELFGGLVGSWRLTMEAEGKSPKTLETQGWGPLQLTAWLLEHGHPADDVRDLTTEQIRQWLTDLATTKAEATCRTRYVGLKGFLAWCVAEGELATDPMANVRPPVVHEQVMPMLTTDQLRAVLADCQRGPHFTDVRDHAMVLFMADTGCRVSELVGMTLPDLDLRERTAAVVGKGSRPRVVPFGAKTARALDKYLRMRRRDPHGASQWVWLSATSKGRLTRNGVLQALRRRGSRLGLHLHPHMFRHGFADAWLTGGGSETDLMELAGWRSRQMVGRYASARRAERARDAYRSRSPMDAL